MKIGTHNFIEMIAEDSVVDLNGDRSVLCLSHLIVIRAWYKERRCSREIRSLDREIVRERNLKKAGLYRWESFQDCGEMWGKQAHDRFLTRMCHQRAAGKCSQQALAEAQGAGRIFKKGTFDAWWYIDDRSSVWEAASLVWYSSWITQIGEY